MRPVFVLLIVLNSTFAFAQMKQATIDSLLKQESHYDGIPDTFSNGIQLIFREITYNCHGDLCVTIKYGLKSDSSVLPPVFDQIKEISDSTFFIRLDTTGSLLSSDFKLIRKNNMKAMDYGFFAFREGKLWGVLNERLDMAIEADYDDIFNAVVYDEYGGGAWLEANRAYLFIALKNAKVGIFDINGRTVLPFQYEHIYDDPGYDGAVVLKDAKAGYLRYPDMLSIPVQYDTIVSGISNFMIRKQGKWAIYSPSGDEELT